MSALVLGFILLALGVALFIGPFWWRWWMNRHERRESLSLLDCAERSYRYLLEYEPENAECVAGLRRVAELRQKVKRQ